MVLRDAAPGVTVRLDRIETTADLRRRLVELGFVPGRVLRVLSRGATGGLLLAVGDARIAVDAEICRALRVDPVLAGLR